MSNAKERLLKLTAAEAFELCIMDALFMQDLDPELKPEMPNDPEVKNETKLIDTVFPGYSLNEIKVIDAIQAYSAINELRKHFSIPQHLSTKEAMNIIARHK